MRNLLIVYNYLIKLYLETEEIEDFQKQERQDFLEVESYQIRIIKNKLKVKYYI